MRFQVKQTHRSSTNNRKPQYWISWKLVISDIELRSKITTKQWSTACIRSSISSISIPFLDNPDLARAVNRPPCLLRGMTRRAFPTPHASKSWQWSLKMIGSIHAFIFFSLKGVLAALDLCFFSINFAKNYHSITGCRFFMYHILSAKNNSTMLLNVSMCF